MSNPQKVNERLFDDHKRRQNQIQSKQRQAEMQNRMMSYPNLNFASPKAPYHNFQKLSTTDGKQIVERLLGYKQKRNNMTAKYADPE